MHVHHDGEIRGGRLVQDRVDPAEEGGVDGVGGRGQGMAAEPDRYPDVVEAAPGDEREVLGLNRPSPVPFVRSFQSIAEVDALREVSGGGRRNARDERLRTWTCRARAPDRAENHEEARRSENRTPMTVAAAHFCHAIHAGASRRLRILWANSSALPRASGPPDGVRGWAAHRPVGSAAGHPPVPRAVERALRSG